MWKFCVVMIDLCSTESTNVSVIAAIVWCAGELQRKIGVKVLGMGGNSIVG
jgi:hypothetical protein